MISLKDIALIALSPLFCKVNVESLRPVLEASGCSVESAPKNRLVIQAGAAYEELLIVIEGELYAQMITPEGRIQVLESFKPYEMVGSAILFSSNATMPVSVCARHDSRIARIPRSALLELCTGLAGPSGQPEILQALLADMGDRVLALANQLYLLRFATLRHRLAAWIIAASKSFDSAGDSQVAVLDFSKESLAEILGVARPSLSRELISLAKMGIIATEGRTIRILDLKKLSTLAQPGDTTNNSHDIRI